MQAGYAASSLDEVAEKLGATKGMIYHHYRSKADLFFEVHRRGMEINFSAIEPIALSAKPLIDRFEGACRAHVHNMLENLSFQCVVHQGVDMHLFGSTTPSQREKLRLLMEERERYEGHFRTMLVEGRDAGIFDFGNPSFASKAVLAVLNNPVLWYRARENEDTKVKPAIVNDFTGYAMNTVLKNPIYRS